MIGQTIAHYRIRQKIGAGGMGEVYRATDTRLVRDVALKVLPEAFACDAQRMMRFEREAKVLASLNHPNIASIYGLEESGTTRALAMELVEGPTLSDRIKQGAIPLDEGLPIAKQIAEGLEFAHERGIVHRDLKPSNVKLTPEGQVKVLDFGLAKALERDASEEGLQDSPTLTAAETHGGTLLGTASYMSPEQARGKRADRRADIWGFGCVLYEMLAGQRAFSGETTSDTLAAVIRSEPDWSSLPPSTPPCIRELLQRCLQKDPRRRLQAIGDGRIVIEEVLSGSADRGDRASPGTTPLRWRFGIASAAGAIVAALATGLVFWSLRPGSAPKRPTRFAITLPAGDRLALAELPAVAVSPDGTQLVYVAGRGETTQLYLRSMNRLEVTPMPDTQNASGPFFSPDGKWVGFFADGKLKKTSVQGELPVTLCDAPSNRGGSWGPDDTIIFTPFATAGLMRIPAAGGSPQALTTPDPSKGERTHRWPEILPGGKAVLFTIGGLDSSSYYLDAKIAVQSLETGERKMLPVTGTYARYEPSGYLVLVRRGGLFAVPFDLKRLQVTGQPTSVIEDVGADYSTGAGHFSLSPAGSLVYVRGGWSPIDLGLAWVDRKGTVQEMLAPAHGYSTPRLSPDGKRIAVSVFEGRAQNIWMYDIPRGTLTRFTYGQNDISPAWTPDGKRIAYMSEQKRNMAINWKAADGSGSEETLVAAQSSNQIPGSFSPDGKYLAFTSYGANLGGDIWIVPLEGEHQPRPIVQTKFEEHGASFSPDGRWIAYAANETGRLEVYVQPFPGPGGKWQVSTDGGDWPVWARSGRELFYLNGNKIMGAAVSTNPTFAASTPRVLADPPMTTASIGGANGYMDVSQDGQRFLIVKSREAKGAPAELVVVLNWGEDLKRLVPEGPAP